MLFFNKKFHCFSSCSTARAPLCQSERHPNHQLWIKQRIHNNDHCHRPSRRCRSCRLPFLRAAHLLDWRQHRDDQKDTLQWVPDPGRYHHVGVDRPRRVSLRLGREEDLLDGHWDQSDWSEWIGRDVEKSFILEESGPAESDRFTSGKWVSI